jgi:hypothetical protein
LERGDVVTAFGTMASKERMIERLNAGADEPTAEIWLDEIEAQGAEGGPEAGSADSRGDERP